MEFSNRMSWGSEPLGRFFQKPPVQGQPGHSESGLLRTGPWQGYFESFPDDSHAYFWLRQDLKIRGLKKLWLVVKHLPWVANWEMDSLIKYLKYHRPQKILSPSLSSFSSSVSVLVCSQSCLSEIHYGWYFSSLFSSSLNLSLAVLNLLFKQFVEFLASVVASIISRCSSWVF